uniref:HTH psq-type domain-containing protein n=1 Tax=Heliothis virescens TaxID=7102 RepID=A0A2A4JEE2_HELVI
MPFNYQRKEHKRKRSNLDYHAIKSALDAIANGKSIRAAGIAHGIDTNTLRNYAVNKNKLKKLIELGGQHKSSQVFTVQEEIDLVEYLHSCRRMNNGLSRSEALTLACEFAKRNIKKIPESWLANNCAGVHWYRAFYKRHPELCLKSPEDAEASASAKIQKLLETCKETDSVDLNIKQEHDFEVSIIETGATMVQEKIEKKNKAEQVCPNCHVVLPESFQATQFRHEQVRSVIAKVYHFLEREYDELKCSYPDTDWSALSDVRRRAAAATGVTEPLVRAILGEEADKRAAAKTAAAAKKPAPKRARTAKKKKKKLKRTSDTDDDDDYRNSNNDDDSAKQNEDLL